MCYLPLDRLPETGRRALRQHEPLPSAGRCSLRSGVGDVYLEAQLVEFLIPDFVVVLPYLQMYV
jgi:hypothetical protein